MKQKHERATADRRSFLKLASVGAVAGSAALVTGKGTAQATTQTGDSDKGYVESEHFKKYYDSAKF